MGGVVDMVTGESNRKASNAANRATANQEQIIERMTKLFDKQLGLVEAADASGQFDPTEQIRLATERSQYEEGRQRGNDASVARTLGYRPGDTEPVIRDRGTSERFDLARKMQNFDIRQSAFQNKLNAYNSTASGMLGQASQGYGNIAQTYQNRMTDPSAFWKTAAQWYSMSK